MYSVEYALSIINRAAKQYPEFEKEFYAMKFHALFFMRVFQRHRMLPLEIHKKSDDEYYLYLQFKGFKDCISGYHLPLTVDQYLSYRIHGVKETPFIEYPTKNRRVIEMHEVIEAKKVVKDFLRHVINGMYGLTFHHPDDYCNFNVNLLLNKFEGNLTRR